MVKPKFPVNKLICINFGQVGPLRQKSRPPSHSCIWQDVAMPRGQLIPPALQQEPEPGLEPEPVPPLVLPLVNDSDDFEFDTPVLPVLDFGGPPATPRSISESDSDSDSDVSVSPSASESDSSAAPPSKARNPMVHNNLYLHIFHGIRLKTDKQHDLDPKHVKRLFSLLTHGQTL